MTTHITDTATHSPDWYLKLYNYMNKYKVLMHVNMDISARTIDEAICIAKDIITLGEGANEEDIVHAEVLEAPAEEKYAKIYSQLHGKCNCRQNQNTGRCEHETY